MPRFDETVQSLSAVPNLHVAAGVPLAQYTRFGLGGPADLFVETGDVGAFVEALNIARKSGLPHTLIGGGSNLIVADGGYRGVILKFQGGNISIEGTAVTVEAGAVLQTLVDACNAHGLKGLETMTGIPGLRVRRFMGTPAPMGSP